MGFHSVHGFSAVTLEDRNGELKVVRAARGKEFYAFESIKH